MTETKQQPEGTPEQRWQPAFEARDAFATIIDQLASEQSGSFRARVREISRFFKNDGTFESAIVRPDVIAFAAPLLNSTGHEPVSEKHLTWAAENGMSSLYCQPTSVQRFFQLMIYPALLAVAGFGIYLGFAFFVAPEFEQMFKEFGIELPTVTNFILDSARVLRRFAWLIGTLLVAFALFSVLWFFKPGLFVPRLRSLERVFSNKRHIMADVALHAAQLRSMGLSSQQALTTATSVSTKSSLKLQTSPSPPDLTHDEPIDGLQMIESPAFALLSFAIQQPATEANNRMLFEVADCYRRRIVTVSDWWVQWLVFGFQWSIMACVGFLVLSIFMPLISIIGGLTGG